MIDVVVELCWHSVQWLPKSLLFTSNFLKAPSFFLTFIAIVLQRRFKYVDSFDSDPQFGGFMEAFYCFVRFEFSLLIFCSVCCIFRLITYRSPPILDLGHACWWKNGWSVSSSSSSGGCGAPARAPPSDRVPGLTAQVPHRLYKKGILQQMILVQNKGWFLFLFPPLWCCWAGLVPSCMFKTK